LARRAKLINEWQIPSGGAAAISEDRDSFEHHLRIISEFLHDGISLRPSLSDTIDLLAQEAQEEMPEITSNALRRWMFKSGKFKGNSEHYYLPENSDLCWVAQHGVGNPLSLSTLFIMIGHLISTEKLLTQHKDISLAAKMAVKIDTPLGHILWRFLRNLEYAFNKTKRPQDAKLFDQLAKSLH